MTKFLFLAIFSYLLISWIIGFLYFTWPDFKEQIKEILKDSFIVFIVTPFCLPIFLFFIVIFLILEPDEEQHKCDL